jgi:hypothetical protein
VVPLLLKDARVTAPLLWLIAPIWLLVAINASASQQALFWSAVVLAAILGSTAAVVEWQADTDAFLCSLPVDRAVIVRARYAWAGVAALASLGAWIAVGAARQTLAPNPAGGEPIWATVEGVLAFGVILAVLAVVYLPCHVACGAGRGAAIFSAILLGLLVGGTVLTAVMPVRPFVGSPGAVAAPDVWIRNMIAGVRQWGGIPAALIVTGGVGGALIAGSMRLATRLYGRRDF